MDIKKRLFDLQDEKYRKFNAKLTPNISEDKFIGVRSPNIKELAKEIQLEDKERCKRTCNSAEKKVGNDGENEPIEVVFLDALPHEYVEEYILHAHLINMERDFSKCVSKLNNLLPYIDNWMTCDALRPAIFKKHLDEAEQHIKSWVDSRYVYTSRFGIEMLMTYYLNDAFKTKHLEWVRESYIEEYYHKMMVAWYFATALAKQWDETIKYVEGNALETWTHNKTIQKARESFRISEAQKEYLKKLKRK